MGFFSSLFESSGKPADKLIEASKSGATEKIRSLLAEGADMNARDQEGWTALMRTSAEGQSYASWYGRVSGL
jgi:ankyrin repeat protein